MITLSVLVALASYRFIPLGVDLAFANLGESVLEPRGVFMMHIIASPIALCLGTLQFLPKFRAKHPATHRWIGRIYALAILFGGIAGLLLALDATDRPIAATGFAVLAILWLSVTAQAVCYAWCGKFVQHQRMMIRSFALTFAAVTLRLQLPFLLADGTPYLEISHIVAWSCWIPNLIFAEFWLFQQRSAPHAHRHR